MIRNLLVLISLGLGSHAMAESFTCTFGAFHEFDGNTHQFQKFFTGSRTSVDDACGVALSRCMATISGSSSTGDYCAPSDTASVRAWREIEQRKNVKRAQIEPKRTQMSRDNTVTCSFGFFTHVGVGGGWTMTKSFAGVAENPHLACYRAFANCGAGVSGFGVCEFNGLSMTAPYVSGPACRTISTESTGSDQKETYNRVLFQLETNCRSTIGYATGHQDWSMVKDASAACTPTGTTMFTCKSMASCCF